MNKELKEKSHKELIDELFFELEKMTDEEIVEELRSTPVGPLRIAMDPMYVANKIFDYEFYLKFNSEIAEGKESVLWSEFIGTSAFACNDPNYYCLPDDHYLMAA